MAINKPQKTLSARNPSTHFSSRTRKGGSRRILILVIYVYRTSMYDEPYQNVTIECLTRHMTRNGIWVGKKIDCCFNWPLDGECDELLGKFKPSLVKEEKRTFRASFFLSGDELGWKIKT